MEEEYKEETAATPVDGGSAEGADVKAEASPQAEAKWYDGIADEELRGNPNITKHKDVAGLAKAYVEATKKLGQKGIAPLPVNATAEQRAAYNAMRRGDAIKSPEDYSWGKGDDDAGVKALKQSLFNSGADDYMASEILSAIKHADDVAGAEQEAYAQKVYSGEAEKLRVEWGENFEVNLRANDILLAKYPDAERVIKGLGIDRMAGFQLMLHHLNSLSADGQIKFEQAREATLDDKIAAITNSDAYKQTWHPGHEEAKRRRADLILEKTRKA